MIMHFPTKPDAALYVSTDHMPDRKVLNLRLNELSFCQFVHRSFVKYVSLTAATLLLQSLWLGFWGCFSSPPSGAECGKKDHWWQEQM